MCWGSTLYYLLVSIQFYFSVSLIFLYVQNKKVGGHTGFLPNSSIYFFFSAKYFSLTAFTPASIASPSPVRPRCVLPIRAHSRMFKLNRASQSCLASSALARDAFCSGDSSSNVFFASADSSKRVSPNSLGVVCSRYFKRCVNFS